ncbi:MAG: DoxX family protein [Pirellulales bacterium]|nr:DoxX family protein [Pirellulales bacterium]
MAKQADQTAGCKTAVPTIRAFPMALMRMAIGWHFLYEGIVKLLDADWTAAGYLQGSTGPLAGLFQRLAADATTLKVVDQLNIWGLILIGVCLMVGLFARFAAVCGVVLLGLYYAAYPPLFGSPAVGMAEGHYLLVDKNLVELLALCVVAALPAKAFGLDGLVAACCRRRAKKPSSGASAAGEIAQAASTGGANGVSRRQVLAGLTGVPFLGALALAVLKKHGWPSHEEEQLRTQLAAMKSGDAPNVDATTGPSMTFEWAKLDDLKGQVPTGTIGDVQLSRLILGGNLIGGWAHARDLIYVSKLVKAYHHREKVFGTFQLAEACGVNTIITNPLLCDIIGDYWKSTGGKIQFISDCGGQNLLEMIQKSIDNGACACYIQGGVADDLVAKEQFDLIEQALELIRRNGLPAGIGGHKLRTIAACVEKGFEPDFWMKTLHHTDYWSATPQEQQDNIWCEEPEQTIAFMKERKQPWIAFKVLAAGAIHPNVGFQYALENGADFICVGMYDFQIVEDVNIALDTLGKKLKRQREWYA